MAETWRQEHRRLGRPVRGHTMSYRDIVSRGDVWTLTENERLILDGDATRDYYDGKMSPEAYSEIVRALWNDRRLPDESAANREAIIRKALLEAQ